MRKSWLTWVLRVYYGVEGPLDEYKRSQLNQMGNYLSIFLMAYLATSELVLFIAMFRVSATWLLAAWLVVNLVVTLGITGWMDHRVHQLGLDDIDVTTAEYPRQLHRLKIRALCLAIYAGVLYQSGTFLADWAMGMPLMSVVTKPSTWINLLIFVLIMGFSRYYYLKRKIRRFSDGD